MKIAKLLKAHYKIFVFLILIILISMGSFMFVDSSRYFRAIGTDKNMYITKKHIVRYRFQTDDVLEKFTGEPITVYPYKETGINYNEYNEDASSIYMSDAKGFQSESEKIGEYKPFLGGILVTDLTVDKEYLLQALDFSSARSIYGKIYYNPKEYDIPTEAEYKNW